MADIKKYICLSYFFVQSRIVELKDKTKKRVSPLTGTDYLSEGVSEQTGR